MYWDCPMCGRKGIISTERQCSCGYVFGTEKSDHFRMPLPGEGIVEVENNNNPDELIENWRCAYCGAYNPYSKPVCSVCGYPRDESSEGYFSATGIEKSSVSKSLSEGDIYEGSRNIYEEKTVSEISRAVKGEDAPKTLQEAKEEFAARRYDEEAMRASKERMRAKKRAKDAEAEKKLQIAIKEQQERKAAARRKHKRLFIILAVIAAIAVALGFILFIPHEGTFLVTGTSWEREIQVEKEKTFSESGWSLPEGARLDHTAREIRRYDQVLDHYETVTVTEYKSVPKTEYYYEDLGNGNAQRKSRTVYESVPYQTTEQRPVYKDIPVYDTKYYYDIDRYVYERSVRTQGETDPYWGDAALESREREGKRSEKYFVHIDDNGEKRVQIPYEDWIKYHFGDEIHVKKNLAGMYFPSD